jgi:hypothetical protein
MRETNNFCPNSVVLTVWLAMAGPSKHAHISDVATKRELYMNTESEEKGSIADENDKLLHHQEPFCA